MKTVKDYQEDNEMCQKMVLELFKKIKELEASIKENKDIIYERCEHTWDVDHSVYSERTEYYCTQCGLDQRY